MPVEHGWKPENQHRQYALEQYSKALHAMRQIFKKKPLSWARNTIISCLLTTYIEAYLGDRDNPFAQAQAGIELIERIEVSNDSTRAEEFGYSSTTPTSLDNDLICIFARFEAIMIWCKEIHKSTGQSHHLRVLPSATFLKEIPSTFNTIKDAKYCWDLSLTRFVRYQIAMSEQAYDKDGESLAEKMPKSPFRTVESTKILRQETERFIKACQQWYQCFSPLLQQAREKPGTHENLGAVSLNGQYLAAFITLSLSAEEAECTCDNFLDEFITIIEDAETVLSSRLWATSKVKLGLDCTVIWRLSMVSMKCRDRVVRRRAIELMRKCAMGEGPRNGAMAAAIATSMMEREEQGVVGDYIPEEARLKVIRTEIILEERKVKIVCSKLVEGSEKKEELPEVTVTWRR
jgi:hypothetical protein